MEVDSVYINLEDYDFLIEHKIESEQKIESLKKELESKNSIESMYEDKFLKDLLDTEKYHIEKLVDENSIIGTYHYNELQERFFEIGIVDLNYIYEQINHLLEMYKEQKESNNIN